MSWKPYPEVYCGTCRRMVRARRRDDGRLIPDVHYRYAGSYDMDPLNKRSRFTSQCAGVISNRQMDHGMEDPVAAFHGHWSRPVTGQDQVKVAPTVTTASQPSARFWWWSRT